MSTATHATTIEEALGKYLVAQNVATQGESWEEIYAHWWFYVSIRGVKLPFFPRVGFRRGLPAHDTHHMLNGYATNWVGECETAAWELASGGCGLHLMFWIDRLFFIALAMLSAPNRTIRAWRRGRGQRNLYRLQPDELLSMSVADVRRYVGC